eukprot:TRINITY_DN12446_c0_g1_i1.p1 TRINITY_DN12446_c0_g1~~TRINITY_DN12446_c0_g1_i1.p1  ORF type:complete len:234 (-),score=28.03 TRINITY_DN12446_c0_g1_i1:230-931(-)
MFSTYVNQRIQFGGGLRRSVVPRKKCLFQSRQRRICVAQLDREEAKAQIDKAVGKLRDVFSEVQNKALEVYDGFDQQYDITRQIESRTSGLREQIQLFDSRFNIRRRLRVFFQDALRIAPQVLATISVPILLLIDVIIPTTWYGQILFTGLVVYSIFTGFIFKLFFFGLSFGLQIGFIFLIVLRPLYLWANEGQESTAKKPEEEEVEFVTPGYDDGPVIEAEFYSIDDKKSRK